MSPLLKLELLQKRVVGSPEEMRRLCVDFTREHLSALPVSLLLLEGELGAGKTAFCRGFMEALEISDSINSPTFNLLNEYEGLRGRFYHFDLYRLQSAAEAEDSGFAEIWRGRAERGEKKLPLVMAVEWWSRAQSCFTGAVPTFYIRIDYNVDVEDAPRDVSIYRHVRDSARI